jgi:hypothetical protein
VVGHRVSAIPDRYIAGHGFSQKHELVSNEAACIHTRLDARDPHNALLSMIAFQVET